MPEPLIATAGEGWRRIPIAPDYEVSSEGRVRRARGVSGTFAGRVLRPDVGSNGYSRVGLIVDGKLKKVLVHRAVCWAFHGSPPSSKHQAAHGDGDRKNNRPGNLRWATAKENIADIAIYASPRTEERAANRKLSREQVHQIRNAPRSYGFATKLAAKHGVSVSCIAAIRDSKRGLWPTVPFHGDVKCQ